MPWSDDIIKNDPKDLARYHRIWSAEGSPIVAVNICIQAC